MYETYWQLDPSPFRSGIDPDQYFANTNHDEALARLHYLAVERRRLGILLGPAGCGKSLVLEIFAREQRRASRSVVNMSLLGIDPYEFLWNLADQFGLFPPTSDSMLSLWRGVLDRLTENRYQQIPTILLFDDADEAESDTLTQILRIAHSDHSPEQPMSIVLSSATERIDLLGARLLDLAELRIDVEPWSVADTNEFLRRANSFSGRQQDLFSAEAVSKLHALTRGVPRGIKQLADLCLLAGAGQSLAQVDADTVENVHRELEVRVESSSGRRATEVMGQSVSTR